MLASTPKPIIEKISKGLVKAMKHKVFANYLASAGLTVEGMLILILMEKLKLKMFLFQLRMKVM